MESQPLIDRANTFWLSEDVLHPQRAHLIGIAGSGMRAMADVLAGWGWQVSGSDCCAPSPPASTTSWCPPLAGEGRFFLGHAAEHVSPETELVIYSDAIPAGNPELRRAAELGIPAISYFQMLGRLSADRHTVAIAGTHGKSSTTAMAAHILTEAGHDPTVFCGATPFGKTSGGRASQCSRHTPCAVRSNFDADCPPSERHTECACYNGLILIEACEYRANFLHLRPQHAAIMGIESDHFDCYDSLEQIEAAFRQFAASVPSDGLLLVRHDCESTRRATTGLTCRVESFGLCPEADWSAHRVAEEGGHFRFEIQRLGQTLCEVRLQMPGRHNVLNALAAAALAYANGTTADQIAAGLSGFAGLHRRLEVLGTWRGVTLVDDYAHHPTEVTVTLAAIRQMFPRRRVWCVFQPHQASRTARLLDELAASLQNADRLLVAEIFRAREGDPQPGEITAADLAQRAAALGASSCRVGIAHHECYGGRCPPYVLPGHTAEEILRTLETHLVAGDVLVTLGAGDVAQLRPNVEIKMTKEGQNQNTK